MVGISVKVIGAEGARNYLKKMESSVKTANTNALVQASAYMEAEVKASIAGQRAEKRSVDTGRFMNSVSHKVSEDSAIVFTDVPYSDELEYGTTRIAPRRHFNNSLDRNRKKIKDYFESEIAKKL